MRNPARHLLKHWHLLADSQTAQIYGLRINTPREMPLRHAIFKGTHEYDAVRMIRQSVRPGDKVLEIGTGLGVTGLVATQQAGEGNVLCYEADSSLEPLIRSNYRLNGWEPNLVMQPVTSDGRPVRLFRSEAYKPDLTSLFGGSGRPSESAEIDSQAIGEVLREHPPDVLIMDAEGAEAELLSLATLPKTRVAIIEMHPFIIGNEAVAGLIETMKRNGFDLIRKGKTRKGLFLARPQRTCNYLFERPAQ